METSTEISAQAIRTQLEKILASPGFIHSDRMVRFLRFTVEQTIRGQADSLKEFVLGMEVFDRTASFDPRTDTIVRVEARRLRSKLTEYYQNEGRNDLLEIEFPKGGYIPAFRRRVPVSQALDVALPSHSIPEIESSHISVFKKKFRWRPDFRVAAGAVMALVASAGVTFWLARSAPATKPIKLVRLTSDSGLTFQPTLSPDGKLLVYASDRSGDGNLDLWLKQIDGGEPVRLTHDIADDCEPSFSPDGTRIVFRSERDGGGIYVVPAIGGEERLVVREGLRPKVSPDGKQIAYFVGSTARNLTNNPSKIFLVPSHGGQPQLWQSGFQFARNPVWSPEGNHLMFWGCRKMGECDWWVGSLDGNTAVQTGALGLLRGQKVRPAVVPPNPSLAPAWLPGAEADRLIFAAQSGDSTSLWQLILSRKTWQAVGPLQQVTAGTALEIDPTYASGHLVFSNLTLNTDVWTLPIDSNKGKVLGRLEPVIQSADEDMAPSISSDSKHLVFLSSRSRGIPSARKKELDTGKEVPLTEDPRSILRALVSPDGSKVVYQPFERDKLEIYLTDYDGEPCRKICDNCGTPLDWSADGTEILYHWGRPIRFSLLRVASGETHVVLQHPKYDLHRGQLSPDRRWIAFHVPIESTRSPVFIAPLRPENPFPESEWISITDGLGLETHPFWSPDGNLLYFMSDRDGFRCIFAQPLNPATKQPRGAPLGVYHIHSARRSFLNLHPGMWGLSLAHHQLVFSLGEITGNIWMTELGK